MGGKYKIIQNHYRLPDLATKQNGSVYLYEILQPVRLIRKATVQDGRILPLGSRGTIVYIYLNAPAYEVEFSSPFNAVVTLVADDIRPR
jgi:hypothetical protein